MTRDRLTAAVAHLAGLQVLDYLTETQDPRSGSWIAAIMHTLMGVAALRSLGVPKTDARYRRGVESLGMYRIDLGNDRARYVARL